MKYVEAQREIERNKQSMREQEVRLIAIRKETERRCREAEKLLTIQRESNITNTALKIGFLVVFGLLTGKLHVN